MIKENNPKSLKELSALMEKDSGTIQRKITVLQDYGLLEVETGNINNMKTPTFNYDKIEIAI